MSSEIYLFDTYSRQNKLFVSLKPGEVTIYTCGPTVYDYPHIGNLRAYIFSDILRRSLEFNDYKVTQVINITDVGHLVSDADEGEDKMEMKAREQKRSALEMADFYTQTFKKNLVSLNIESPNIWCKATEHIKEQIDLIKRLEKLGYTYQTSDGIYFNTSKVDSYGYLGRIDVGGMQPGSRVELNSEKMNPTDFALWKLSPGEGKRQMEWESPWGTGFPGWHIECSAMAMKYLGETIDIHTGGIDHIPVHHTNEIAQSEAATGKKFVDYWLHVAFLTVNGGKMSKSLHNFITLKDIIDKGHDPLAFRYLALGSHYRAGLNFTWQSFLGAQEALSSIREKILSWGKDEALPDKDVIEDFKSRINNDLNTPQVLGLLWETVASKLPVAVRKATVLEFDKVLGLRLSESEKYVLTDIPSAVKGLTEKREILRKEKKWRESDEVRKQINTLGYDVDDTLKGSRIKKKS